MMSKIPKAARPTRQSQQGVMLIEALVAILLFALGIVAVMGLQANMIAQTTQAKYRVDASYLANQIIGQMWVDRTNLPNYDTASGASSNMTSWRTRVAATLPGITVGGTNSPQITVAGQQVSITISWRLPGADTTTRQYSVVAQINGS